MSGGHVAGVVAGAEERGGYEAGALYVLVPPLRAALDGELTSVGTSAAAINAAGPDEVLWQTGPPRPSPVPA
jgi:hypothetical protein